MLNVMSVVFGGLGVVTWTYLIVVQPSNWSLIFGFILGIFCTFFALIFGAISAIELARKKAKVVSYTIGIIACFISAFMMIYSIRHIAFPLAKTTQRGAQMSDISLALELYKRDHSGKLPIASTWCDLIVDDQFLTSEQLVITSKDKTPRNYAMNVNVIGLDDIPKDIVLIFESGTGWNLVGGKELLVKDNYKSGCWIIFGGLYSRYVYLDEYVNLQWTQPGSEGN